ncbi:aminoacyl-tRNA hydrolase [Candidatus Cardinium hertigii]|uniref:Peptidyl-tRNA hydrolase n=2 Tax=Candidatus Cardinium hertigii TaxID=247481 RepID=A0A3N2QAS8_9BACT|nr:aminoacyl-tRNA hydrolase [Candidatus Cardinium hertigii]ROT46898.1 aminoacyl-tRNA hydrolase [Candidatus Cardinium hertigii]
MKLLLVGLGNIGADYVYTRHNVGFLVIDHLARQQKVTFQADRLAVMASFAYKDHQVYLIKPTTYMNNSGKAVRYWLNTLQIPIEQMVVTADDVTLPFGTMRLRAQGSAAGHNGLKSIAAFLAADYYPRLRVGIGNDFPKGGLGDFVMENFSPKALKELSFQLDKASEILLTWCHAGIVHAMNQFN